MRRLPSVVVLLLAGCSSFDQAWEAYTPAPGPAPLAELLGCWDGTWRSDVNGHEGSLRCIISPNPGGVSALFYATYHWGLLGLSFDYSLPLSVVVHSPEGPGPKTYLLRGGAELGCWIAGGTYTYEGRAEAGEFRATYCSGQDRGIFRMKRAK